MYHAHHTSPHSASAPSTTYIFIHIHTRTHTYTHTYMHIHVCLQDELQSHESRVTSQDRSLYV